MKKIAVALFIVLLLSSCAPATAQVTRVPEVEAALLVSIGDHQFSFSMEDLQGLSTAQASFKGVAYMGVTMSTLMDAAGFGLEGIKAVQAVATDGFSVNYDVNQIINDDVIVAFALADGSPLSADDGNFRMVLPDEEGKLNLRLLAELKIVQ